MRGFPVFFVVLSLAVLVGCASAPTGLHRRAMADAVAAGQHWQKVEIEASPYTLTSYLPENPEGSGQIEDNILTVYIEGDGFAWSSPSRISSDPTPIDPIGLRLALAHPVGKVAYLARPCQYVDIENNSACSADTWTSHRFSGVVVDSCDKALSILLQMTSSSRLRLVGYSGGGAIAVLVAAKRKDVEQLVTVAGNLDHAKWVRKHNISSLTGSFNPIDFWQQLVGTPQVHLVGGKDSNIDIDITRSFLSAFPVDNKPRIRIYNEFTHVGGWVRNWAEIYKVNVIGLNN